MNGKPAIKKLKFPAEIVDVLKRSTWSVDGKTAELPDMLDQPTYHRIKQVFAALGGTWESTAGELGIGAYCFKEDPRVRIEGFSVASAETNNGNGEVPDWVIEMMIGDAEGMPGGLKGKILVPGAGQKGEIVRKIVEHLKKSRRRFELTVIENSKPRADLLRAFFKGDKRVMVIEDDFIDFDWASDYQFVITLAPANFFAIHVMHAWESLGDGGSLAAVGFPGNVSENAKIGKMYGKFINDNGILTITLPASRLKSSGINTDGKFLTGVK